MANRRNANKKVHKPDATFVTGIKTSQSELMKAWKIIQRKILLVKR